MDDIETLARERFGAPNQRMSTRRELRFGRRGSVAVDLEHGLWFDHEAGAGGRLSDEAERSFTKRSSDPIRPRTERRPRFRYVWDKAQVVDMLMSRRRAIGGTPAEVYLRSRAIFEWPHSLMFCPNPLSLLAYAQNSNGDTLALQVTYLDEHGRKTEVHGAKRRTFKAGENWAHFSAVRFPGRGELILCEGVENAASAWLATGRPVWACLGISNMGKAPIGKRRSLTIARDGDAPDSPAITQLRNTVRDLRERTAVRITVTPQGEDLNSIHQRDGLDAVRALIGGAR